MDKLKPCEYAGTRIWPNFVLGTGKSLLEALIFVSTNPQYGKRLFIDLPIQYMKTTSPEHVVYINCLNVNAKTKNN